MPLDVTLDTKGIAWLAIGTGMPSQSMQLRNRSGVDVDVTGGTYELFDDAGTSKATGAIQASSTGELIISPVSYPSDLEPGHYREVWTPTASNATLLPIDRLALVTRFVVAPSVTHNTVLARLAKLTGKQPAGQSGWDEQVEQAWQEVSDWCWQEADATQWWTSDGLRLPHLYLSCAICLELCATGQQGAYAEQAAMYRVMAADAFTASVVSFRDKDGNGSVDAKPATGRRSTFKPSRR